MTPSPPAAPPPVEALASSLARAAALGRQDGLADQHRDIAAAWPEGLPPLLREALRQCYAAGHAHGADVRRENAARRRRAEAPVQSPWLAAPGQSGEAARR